jgi:acyl-CoA synthetase (NDP forming)
MLETLFEVFPLAQKVPLQSHSMAGKRIGVVTTTGGGAAMVVDQLGLRGITVQPVRMRPWPNSRRPRCRAVPAGCWT